MRRFAKISGLSLAAVIAVGIATPAHAANAEEQATDEAEGSKETSILVSARRRDEDLQDVPLAIAAFNDDALREANIQGLEDLAAATPGFQFTNTRALGAPTIRGLAQTDQGGIQTNVGVFLDGVYINNRSGFEFGNMDLARIEVAKGPQSALFGRDSFAGAINYVSRKPELGLVEGFVQVEGGTNERGAVRASVNLPLGDSAAVRVFGGISTFDGTIKNDRGGQNLGGWEKRQSIGASLLVEPTPDFRIKVFGVRNSVAEDQPALIAPSFLENNAGAQYVNANGTFFTLLGGEIPTSDTVSLDNRGFGNTGNLFLGYARAEYDFAGMTLSAMVSHAESGFDGFFDNVADLAAVDRVLAGPVSAYFLTDSAGDAAEQQSYELQLASNNAGPVEWLLGGSFYDSSSTLQLASQGALLGEIDNLVQISDFSETLEQEITAVFGALSVDLNDKLTIGGEIRYTDEKQTLDIFQNFILFNIVLADTVDTVGFDYVSGKGTIEFRPNDDHLIYAYAARGVKTGGINGGKEGLPGFIFDPETNWTYEIGSKSTLLDGSLILNTAFYYIDWMDLQTTAPGNLQLGSGGVFNGPAGATSLGVEVDATFYATDNLMFYVSGTVLDPTYNDGFIDSALDTACLDQRPGEFVNSTCNGDVSGNRIFKTSSTQAYAAITHTVPSIFGDFDMRNRFNFSHEGSRPTTSIGAATIPATNLFNYRLTFESDETEIAFWVNNVFDTEWIANVLTTSSTEANTAGNCGRSPSCSVRQENIYPGNGRQVGVTVLQRF